MKPKVSIITSTKDRPQLLKRCIQAIQNSSFTEYEHIIVSDHCLAAESVVNEFSSDTRIKYYKVDTPFRESQGAIAKNIGINNAKSNYICYCDDDNILLPNHIGVLYKKIVDSKLDVVFSLGWHITVKDLKEIELYKLRFKKNLKYNIKENDIKDSKFSLLIIPDLKLYNHDLLNAIHTKDILSQINGWQPFSSVDGVAEDRYIMDKFDKIAKQGYVNDITCAYFARKER